MRLDRLTLFGSSLLLASTGAVAAQSCFEAHAEPGCDDATCEAAVCAEDAFCCESTWDESCVELAKEFCDNGGGGGGEEDFDCSNAVTVGIGDHAFTSSFDPASNIDLEGFCDFDSFGNSVIYNTVWFKWTCPKTEGYVFSTCDQVPFNTRIAIFEAACNPLQVVSCLDDTTGCSSFTTTIGTPHRPASTTTSASVARPTSTTVPECSRSTPPNASCHASSPGRPTSAHPRTCSTRRGSLRSDPPTGTVVAPIRNRTATSSHRSRAPRSVAIARTLASSRRFAGLRSLSGLLRLDFAEPRAAGRSPTARRSTSRTGPPANPTTPVGSNTSARWAPPGPGTTSTARPRTGTAMR